MNYRRSPTVEHSYALDPDWFDRYAIPIEIEGETYPGWGDPEGYGGDGWSMDSGIGADRAGYTHTEYANDSAENIRKYGHDRNSLYYRILSDWSHRRLGDLYTRTLSPAKQFDKSDD